MLHPLRFPCTAFSAGLLAGWLCLLAMGGPAWGNIVIDGYDVDANNRFDSNAFIGAALNWSGVGRSSNGRWATLLNGRWFLSANHHHPATSESVTFWNTNSSSGVSYSRTVTGGSRIGNTDLWVGSLSADLPSSISRYAIASPAIPNIATGLGVFADAPIYVVGLYSTAPNQFAVGMNRYDVGDATPPLTLGTFDAIGFIEDVSGDANYLPYEAYLQSGDSGAPSFVVQGGELKLAGIHSYIDYAENQPLVGIDEASFNSGYDYKTAAASLVAPALRRISVNNFVPSYSLSIASAVPEPSAIWLMALALPLLARRRKRLAGLRHFSVP